MAKKHIHTILFDFDNTLFDTESLKEHLYAMATCHGYTHAQAKEIYNTARIEDQKMTMSLSNFVATLMTRITEDGKTFETVEVNKLIENMHKQGGLIPGAVELLNYCKEQSVQMKLLSLGVRSWQEEKVSQAGLSKWIEEKDIEFTEVVGVGKADVIRTLFGTECSGEGILLVNDKPDETADLLDAFPALHALVRIERRDTRYTEEDFIELEGKYKERVFYSYHLAKLLTALTTQYELS